MAYSAPSHYLNQCIINWILRNKLQWNFCQKSNLFAGAILPRGRRVSYVLIEICASHLQSNSNSKSYHNFGTLGMKNGQIKKPIIDTETNSLRWQNSPIGNQRKMSSALPQSITRQNGLILIPISSVPTVPSLKALHWKMMSGTLKTWKQFIGSWCTNWCWFSTVSQILP